MPRVAKREGSAPPKQGEKYCSTCRRLLPLTEFYFSRRFGCHQSVCKECTKRAAAARKAEMRKSPEYRRMENAQWTRRYNTDEAFKARHNEKAAERKRKVRAKAKAEAVAQVCRNCWKYPCFAGIDTIATNLALTCQSWHLRDKR